MNCIKLLFICLLLPLAGRCQQNPPQAFFTSEAAGAALGNDVIVSIKKYNATEEQINSAAKPAKNAPMSYLQIPRIATNISLFSKEFESKLYCFTTDGKIKWEKTIGYSKRSLASPIAENNGFIYTGEALKDEDKVTLFKTDNAGKLIWEQTLDSLENVDAIGIHENKVNALVSFNISKKISHKDGTYSFNTYPIYFFVQLDIQSGKILKKEYQMMGNYLSSIGYDHPFINSDYSYYMHNKDSAIFLSVAKQDGATVVSENMSKDNKILVLTAGPVSNHYLTLLNKGRNKNAYTIITDFYATHKKYQSELPVEYSEADINRYYIHKNSGDSIISVVCNNKELAIFTTDTEGKSIIYKQVAKPDILPVGTGLKEGKPFIIGLTGRDKPGIQGFITIRYY